MTIVPFLSLKPSNGECEEELLAAIRSVIRSGNLILGENVEEFETDFSRFLAENVFSVGVASGTDALELSLRALGVGHGDEVVTVSHTAIATISAILSVGAIPVLVDIDQQTWNMDPELLEDAITSKTKAIIFVHIYGNPSGLLEAKAVADASGIPFIEDASQAHGATVFGRKVGSFGRTACFSCYPTKNLGALGDAGIVVTADKLIYEKLKGLRQYGWLASKNDSTFWGRNSRLDEVQASVLRVRLRSLESELKAREMIAEMYKAKLSELGSFQFVSPGHIHANHLTVMSLNSNIDRDNLISDLNESGIQTLVHYRNPAHRYKGYRERLKVPRPLKYTEALSPRIISLPNYSSLETSMVDFVCGQIKDLASK